MDQQIRQLLLALAQEDQRVREELARTGGLYQGYHKEMEKVHTRNADVLERLMSGHGWPGRTLCGNDGCEAAWLIAQHAISRPALQQAALAALRKAVQEHDAPRWQAAYLEDRIRTLEGRPQLYGTQFDWDADGMMSPMPIEDRERINERRAAAGLSVPFADHVDRMRKEAEASGERPPRDHKARQEEFIAWAISAGWRT